MYAVACLAVDIFVVLQLYVSFPRPIVVILSVLLIIVLTAFELWTYNRFKMRLMKVSFRSAKSAELFSGRMFSHYLFWDSIGLTALSFCSMYRWHATECSPLTKVSLGALKA